MPSPNAGQQTPIDSRKYRNRTILKVADCNNICIVMSCVGEFFSLRTEL